MALRLPIPFLARKQNPTASFYFASGQTKCGRVSPAIRRNAAARHALCTHSPDMPLIYKIAFAFCLFTVNAGAATASVSVLFVGNSLTQVNDLPGTFQKFAAASALHVAVDVCATTPGGAMFYHHWKKGEALSILREWRPSFLVLQGQSTEPLSESENFVYYARLFKSEADLIPTKTILFSTWARPAGDPYYKEVCSGGCPVEMQRRLNTAYASLANKIGAAFAPVGVAWECVPRVAPTIGLLDGTQHPSPAGTYLAAAVLFRTMFNSHALGCTYYGVLPQTTAHTLQRVADSIPLEAARY